jgi:molybdopterin-guanine dinucleotide biosynthesis protein A
MKRAGIILAGGNSSRVGVDKCLVEIDDERMIERVIDKVKRCVDEIIVVASMEDQRTELEKILDVKILIDPIKGFGPVAGIYEGLKYTRAEYCGIFACDLPFLNVDVVDFLFDSCEGFDAAIPMWKNGYREPMHSVCRRTPMLDACEVAIKRDVRTIFSCVETLKNVNFVPIEDIRDIDPELRSFFNVNTRDDFKRLNEIKMLEKKS